ncbi:MAG: hypothetical protein ABSD38_12945 [Syntrophorhabdales bacterium]|jgi:hypothetical protein
MKETDLARSLLSSAEKDLKAIRNMTDPDLFADEVFGFHAQQAVGEGAVPVPNEMPDRDDNRFLFQVREFVAESVHTSGGQLKGWTREG